MSQSESSVFETAKMTSRRKVIGVKSNKTLLEKVKGVHIRFDGFTSVRVEKSGKFVSLAINHGRKISQN